MAGVFTKILSMIPAGLKKKMRRYTNNRYAEGLKKHHKSDRFMNLGYVTNEKMILSPEDEPHRLNLQLYNELLKTVNIDDKNVLEVGCGLGGGCYYLTKYHSPASVIGIDLADKNILLCNENYNIPNLKFYAMDAENVDFKNAAFDIIVNLESSHGYPARDTKFCSEVVRLLKPGGYFAYGDLLVERDFESFTNALMAAGMIKISERNVTEAIMQARHHVKFNVEKLPFYMPKSVYKNFVVTTDSEAYSAMAKGVFLFKLFIFQK
ncbi:MAG TPA: class I SAM-dependent methyltransferase [Bacteroidia bacterium]|jgi:SAM-dependent methyltransferase|nr:class I SAM-dependent methyltransferase [Bacteroidia bacterium]